MKKLCDKLRGNNYLSVDFRGYVLTCAEVGCASQEFHIWKKSGDF